MYGNLIIVYCMYVIITAGVMPNRRERSWCLSHLPGNGCFISHHCSHKGSKQMLMKLYKLESIESITDTFHRNPRPGPGSSNYLSSSWDSMKRFKIFEGNI